MADDIFQRLREGREPSRQNPNYSFQGDTRPGFRDRPGVTVTPTTQTVRPSSIRVERTNEGDRPPAYEPPVNQNPPAVRRREDTGEVYEWEPPGFGDILADLGLRILEVAIASAAYAVGEEIAYFFRKRRFMPNRGSKQQ